MALSKHEQIVSMNFVAAREAPQSINIPSHAIKGFAWWTATWTSSNQEKHTKQSTEPSIPMVVLAFYSATQRAVYTILA